MIIRDEIAALGREQDALLSEHAQWTARREAEREAPVRKSDAGGLVYRTTEQTAQATAPVADAAVFNGVLSEAQHDLLARSLGKIIAAMRREWQEESAAALVERDRRISLLENELKEIKGLIGGVFAMMGAASATTKMLTARDDDNGVVDLPNWRARRHG